MIEITSYVGSIVDAAIGAHAIVNSSNPEVGLGSGVSGAIREACGGAPFQRDVRERLAEEFDGPLEPGDCLVTSGGTSTAFRWVLHVASVNYRKRDPETGGVTGPSRIRACFAAVLSEANRLASENGLTGAFVLATPLLGAGHGGLGAVRALDSMVVALRGHLANAGGSSLRRIVIATPSESDARLVALAASKFSPTG